MRRLGTDMTGFVRSHFCHLGFLYGLVKTGKQRLSWKNRDRLYYLLTCNVFIHRYFLVFIRQRGKIGTDSIIYLPVMYLFIDTSSFLSDKAQRINRDLIILIRKSLLLNSSDIQVVNHILSGS
jgi:hypothetical protein